MNNRTLFQIFLYIFLFSIIIFVFQLFGFVFRLITVIFVFLFKFWYITIPAIILYYLWITNRKNKNIYKNKDEYNDNKTIDIDNSDYKIE